MKRNLKFLAAAAFMMLAVTALTGSLAKAAGKPFSVGGKKYAYLQEAFDAVKNGQTIRLNANATVTDWSGLHRNVKCTLDLNKKTLSIVANGHIVVSKGTLTVKNGTMKKRGRSGLLFEVQESAGLQVISGTYKGAFDNVGTMTVSGGTFTNLTTNRTALISNGGKLTINGGKFSDSSRRNLLNNWENGTVKITAGTFTGGSGNSLLQNSGAVTISGGTFTGKGEDTAALACYESGSLTINGGTFRYSGPFDSEYTDIYAPEWTEGVLIHMSSWNNKGKIIIKNGTFTSSGTLMNFAGGGTVQIKGGTFKAKAGGILVNDNTTNTTISGGTFSVAGNWGLLYNHSEAKLTVKNGTFKSAWTLLENYGEKSTITVSGGRFTSTMNRPKSAMVLNFNGVMNINGGTFVSRGKKTNGFWVESGKINLGDKAKVTALTLQWKDYLVL